MSNFPHFDLEVPLDRVHYRDGQLLSSIDLRDDYQREARFRRLHNILHDTWGIARGFEVEPTAHNTAVLVEPGLAVDDSGQIIVLSEAVRLDVPESPEVRRWVLTASAVEDANIETQRTLPSVCVSTGFAPWHVRPTLTWRQPKDVRIGPQVALIQVTVSGRVIQGEIDTRVRRYVRPLVRPHTAWGVTEPGRSGWREWGTNFGLELVVNTEEAGFVRQPHYFATLSGEFDVPGFGTGKTSLTLYSDGARFIADPTPDRFTYRIIRTEADRHSFGPPPTPLEAEDRSWSLFWIGIEPLPSCESGFRMANAFSLAGVPLNPLDLENAEIDEG